MLFETSDLAKITDGPVGSNALALLDILTPIAKTYPSETGILSVSAGLQCLGGYGYCDEFPLEQYYRDIRIHPIHEGTTGIQGLDLLGRKVVMNNGESFRLYIAELEQAIDEAGEYEDLKEYALRLKTTLEELKTVTASLVQIALKGAVELFLADATLYLELFGIVTIAWQWLLQGIVAQRALGGAEDEASVRFYKGKLLTMKYFFHYELPKTRGPAQRLMEADGLTQRMDTDLFED